jgi:RNA polymerase sigma factor (TIGR02999 family)
MQDNPDPTDPRPLDAAQREPGGAADSSDQHLPAPSSAPQVPVDALLPQVYNQLRQLARQYMTRERPDHTLQATALVHEAYVRVVGGGRVDWHSQSQFFYAAAEAMRRILIERGRQRRQLKAGGGPNGPRQRIPLTSVDLAIEMDGEEILALDDAISRLEQVSPDVGRVVRLRFYAGLGVEETAQVMRVSPRTVNREWTYARAWLFRELGYQQQA